MVVCEMMKNVKDALSYVRKIVRMSCHFVRIHPNGSGTAAFFLALYLVCPFGFKFLTCAITMFYGIAIIIKVIANSEPYDVHEDNKHVSKNREFPPFKTDSVEGVSGARKLKKPMICAQMSKRRNFKVRLEDPETPNDADRKQVSSSLLWEEENQVNGVGKDLDPLGNCPSHRNEKTEQKDEGIIAQQGESSCSGELVAGKDATNLNEDESFPDFAPETDESNQSREGSRSQSEIDDGSEEAEDAQEDNSPAVEWTEDDQQNLTDLGLSELERNKRLENLIAKRMAKKALSMKAHGNFRDLGISHPSSVPPVNISRNPFVPPHLLGDVLESHLPGSAPSVLLPERNPFDLPYDSNEEKPNLTVDSFGAEILAPHPKDILSRHESFFYGPSLNPEIDQDSGPANPPRFSLLVKWNVREPRHSRFRQKSDKDRKDWLVERILSKAEDPDPQPDASQHPDKNEETTSSIDDNLETSPDAQAIEQHREDASVGEDAVEESESSASEDQIEAAQTSKDNEFSFQGTSPHLVNVLSCENGRYAMEHMDGRSSHTPTFSIASDMHVELSGSSTPRTVADFSFSPDDAESSTHDEDMGRETGFTNDEIWGALSKRNDVIKLDLPESREEEEELPKDNNNNNNNIINYPFGSYISLIDLDREESQKKLHFRHTASPESSSDNDLEVGKARFDDPSNGNISESLASEVENYSVQPTSDRILSKRDEEVR